MFLLDWPGGSWEASLRMTLTVLAIYLAALWITLVFWTYRDIRQRTRDPILQTVAVLLVLVFFLPGHWIYLILRPRYTLVELYERSLEEEALLQELEDQKACPGCNRRIQDEFLLCPYCRTSLKEPCRGCSRPLNRAWLACPFCGMEKPSPPRPPRAARPQGRAGRGQASPPKKPARTTAASPFASTGGSATPNGNRKRAADSADGADDSDDTEVIDATRDSSTST